MNTEDRIHQEMDKIQIQVRIWSYKEPLMSEIIIKGTLMHTFDALCTVKLELKRC